MRIVIPALFIAMLVLLVGFTSKKSAGGINKNTIHTTIDPVEAKPIEATVKMEKENGKEAGLTSNATQFVDYAKTLIGTPYVYGSVDPKRGLDCSGFVNCVSDHFGIKVPRSSVDFTNFGTTIELNNAKPGDLILFTGTDASRKKVGHMGIITENSDDGIEFIHSSSGKAKRVIISELSDHYKERFVKVVRIFPTGAKKEVA